MTVCGVRVWVCGWLLPDLGIIDEPLQAVHKVGAVEGVPADAHHCGLA